jgi:multiple sugar transport system substrate-binding protein
MIRGGSSPEEVRMSSRRRVLVSLTGLATAAVVAAGCGGSGGGGGDKATGGSLRGTTVTVWSYEGQPDRVQALEQDLAAFTAKTGIKTKVVPIPDGQLSTQVTNAAAAGKLPDVLAAISAADALGYVKQQVFDPGAAQDVVDALGRDTFDKSALQLVTAGGKVSAVPSDGWGQLLIYRKDLFKQAGLAAPKTVEDVIAAAQKLNKPGMAGIVLATKPGDEFTTQSFQHIALAEGCQLVDGSGKITIDSPQCVKALTDYANLARNDSVSGNQDVDSTRGTYFAGRAAMLIWSPFLLDGMAGLRNDTKPSCPQCKKDPAFLAKSSGLVGPLSSGSNPPAQFGLLSTFDITVDANKPAAEKVVEYLMSDGYARWLGLSPQGKYPVRPGDASDPKKYVTAWNNLESGVDTKAPLSKFYDSASIDSLGKGAENFQAWGFKQGQAALVGALSGEEPVADAVSAAVNGTAPAAALTKAKQRIQEIQSGLQ